MSKAFIKNSDDKNAHFCNVLFKKEIAGICCLDVGGKNVFQSELTQNKCRIKSDTF